MKIATTRCVDVNTGEDIIDPDVDPHMNFHIGDVVGVKGAGDELVLYSVVGRHFQEMDGPGVFGIIYQLRAVISYD